MLPSEDQIKLLGAETGQYWSLHCKDAVPEVW
jgi:hypothetical protein